MKIPSHAILYGIVDFGYVAEGAMEDCATKLLSGGADILQLRAKGIPLETVAAAARKIIPHCKAAGVPFILNDHPDLAWNSVLTASTSARTMGRSTMSVVGLART